MAASLRNPESVLELSGCDRITMPPNIIEKLQKMNTPVEKKLRAEDVGPIEIEKINLNEKTFRWMMNEDEIGNGKLAEGIRVFALDAAKLESMIKEKLRTLI